jgi:transposase InsO family protein
MVDHYASLGIRVEAIISDNALAYRRSAAFRAACAELGIQQRFIKPAHPWTNGKVERLNRTLAAEWAYSRIWTSNNERAAALPRWLNYYNLERPHLGIGGQRPIDRVNNGPSQNS